ncbi:conserved protein, unknown function [Plasmodium vinckei lentum]|uniref:Protein FAM33A n=1 Tax=Plasmodium vinckei lentum TaxID=138297 RepID=A0A6V7RVG3_PLAVN|nr:conserved protein, unknown function [Plasmodium vinckei lentum]
MELSIDALKEKFMSMNSDIELIEMKLKDEMCKIYEDDINPLLILNDFENIKNEINKINKELDILYERKKMSINYMHRQMQNYNFLLNLENDLNIPSKDFNTYHNSEIILNNFFYDNIKNFLLNVNYDEIKELIGLDYHQKCIENAGTNFNDELNNTMGHDMLNSKNFTTDSAMFNNNDIQNTKSKDNEKKLLNNSACGDDNKNPNDKEGVFTPIDDNTFQTVPSLIRRRAKLDDINLIYKALYDIAMKKGSCLPVERSELTQMNLQVFGQTGEAKIATLRYLKIVEVINKTGSVKLLNCAGLKKKKKRKMCQFR